MAKLNKTMYGTQDACNAWQKLWGEPLRSKGFELSASNPALYKSELVNGFCHGDDFVVAAAEDQIEVFGKLLKEKFDTRQIGMIGAAKHLDQELEVLHRSVRVINDELMEIEADQKHVPRLLEDLGHIRGNVVKTPRVKLSATGSDAIENSSILEGEQATLFRSGTMRCAYLAQDRADISEAIKCLAKGMSRPRIGHMMQLKRVARYLKGMPRMAQQYTAQEPSKAHLEVYVDSDWAGDTVTRRSTTGVIVRRGQHLLRHSSTVQNVIGLTSAESEYYALTEGGCSGLGLQSLFADWNLKLQLSLHTDSSSAKAIASRRGTGKSTRRIQTRMLWLQERVAAKHLRIMKVASESDPADMLTKALGRLKIEEFCAEIGQTEPCAETLDKEFKGVKKLKEVKFAVQAIEMDEMVRNRFKDARIERAKNKLKKIAKIKNDSKIQKLQWMYTMD